MNLLNLKVKEKNFENLKSVYKNLFNLDLGARYWSQKEIKFRKILRPIPDGRSKFSYQRSLDKLI